MRRIWFELCLETGYWILFLIVLLKTLSIESAVEIIRFRKEIKESARIGKKGRISNGVYEQY